MSEEKRKHTRFTVNWKARVSLPDRSLYEVNINDVSVGGVAINFRHVLSVGTAVNIEFFVRYRNDNYRIRAKTEVVFNTVLSDNRGAKLGLQFINITGESRHALANVLNALGEDVMK